VRRLPDPTSRLVTSRGAQYRLGGAVPSPAAAFLLALILLPSLFWLVALKRTTTYLEPEEWLMQNVVVPFQAWMEANLPFVDAALTAISALGSGWFVGLGFAVCGLFALAKGRRDLALLLALGTLAFPMEWALKYFVAIPPITLNELIAAMFNVGGTGLDDIAVFPAGHALRAMAFYGLVAFCIARLSSNRRQGMIAYAVAAVLIGAIGLVRIYLNLHYPLDVVGGWMAGAALISVLIAIHVLNVDERMRAAARQRAANGKASPGSEPAAAPEPLSATEA
jgi:membrane-associated phospholipid phosphatase